MRVLSAIVLLSLICSSWAFSCVSNDDIGGEEVIENKPFMPRKAVYLDDAEKSNTMTEIIVRSLTKLPDGLKNLPLTKRNLTDLPKAKQGDKVYELSSYFPNCDTEKSDLWVVYNASSSYIIASVDPLLRASVNEFVYYHSVDQMMKMRISFSYLHVEENVPLEIQAIKKCRHQRVMSFSGEFRSGEKTNLANSSNSLQLELIMSQDGFYADAVIKLEEGEEEKSMISATFEFGKEYIIETGVIEGNSRGVLIVRLEDLDVCGREAEVHTSLAERINSSKQIFYDWRCHYCPYNLDLDMLSDALLNGKPINLVVPPRDSLFRQNDVVYDLKQAMVLQGIEMGLDDKLLYNKTVGQIFCLCSYENYEQIQDLFGTAREANMLHLSASVLEVDSTQLTEDVWTLESVLASHPVHLGRIGYVTRSGEITRLNSKYGTFIWQPIIGIIGESNYYISNYLEMDLTLQGREIKALKEDFLSRKNPIFIELQRDSETNKTIVMMMSFEIYRIGYHEKLHNRK